MKQAGKTEGFIEELLAYCGDNPGPFYVAAPNTVRLGRLLERILDTAFKRGMKCGRVTHRNIWIEKTRIIGLTGDGSAQQWHGLEGILWSESSADVLGERLQASYQSQSSDD